MASAAMRGARLRSATGRQRGAASLCAVAAALMLAHADAPAATYKWTDANGRVIYSDQPPTGNFKVESISAPPPPANPNAVKELATKEAEIQQRRLLKADEQTKAAKAQADANVKREQCAKARGQIAMLQSDPALMYRANEKGERVLMDDGARRRERETVEAWVRENCAR